MKVELLREMPVLFGAMGEQAKNLPPCPYDKRFVMAPAGTPIEGPDAYHLVHSGVAKPADDECRQKCGLTDQQVLERYQAYDLLDKAQFTGDPTVDALTQ